MAKNNNLTDFVRDLADGFREKLGWPSTDKINPQDFRDFIEHSPSVGTLTTGLESLNITKTIVNDVEQIYPGSDIETSFYFDESTGTQLFPLIQFQITAIDALEGTEEIRVADDGTDGTIGTLTATNSTVTYILPIFADLKQPKKYPCFPYFDLYGENIRAAGVRVKITAKWVQIGSTQYPMRLSGATMGGIK